MKTLFYLLCILSAFFYSCTSGLIGIGFIDPKCNNIDEVYLSQDLKSFLDTNRFPKLVLRVPTPPSKVTEAEIKQFNSYNECYNEIEKQFLKLGFTVRDRGLLNNLMINSNANYQEIGKKIDTDFIIEIIEINYHIPIQNDKFYDTKTNEIFIPPKNSLETGYAKIEGKIINVEKGKVDGAFTLFVCNDGKKEFEYVYNPDDFVNLKKYRDLSWIFTFEIENNNSIPEYFDKLIWTLDINEESRKETSKIFAKKIINIFTKYE